MVAMRVEQLPQIASKRMLRRGGSAKKAEKQNKKGSNTLCIHML